MTSTYDSWLGAQQPQSPKVTPEQCVAAGGHCPVSTGEVYASMLGGGPVRCKHCGLAGASGAQPGVTYRWDE